MLKLSFEQAPILVGMPRVTYIMYDLYYYMKDKAKTKMYLMFETWPWEVKHFSPIVLPPYPPPFFSSFSSSSSVPSSSLKKKNLLIFLLDLLILHDDDDHDHCPLLSFLVAWFRQIISSRIMFWTIRYVYLLISMCISFVCFSAQTTLRFHINVDYWP